MMADRYQIKDSVETRFQTGSNGQVLQNLAGITSKVEMDQAEYESLVTTQYYYAENVITSETKFTATLICQMHFDWLSQLYEWAGKYRTVNVEKGGFKWLPYGFIDASMASLESGLLNRYTPARSIPLPELARQMAEIHSEFLLIHPFRDGNGRIARWIADVMAMQANLPVPE